MLLSYWSGHVRDGRGGVRGHQNGEGSRGRRTSGAESKPAGARVFLGIGPAGEKNTKGMKESRKRAQR